MSRSSWNFAAAGGRIGGNGADHCLPAAVALPLDALSSPQDGRLNAGPDHEGDTTLTITGSETN
jgi:hypothetical protein